MSDYDPTKSATGYMKDENDTPFKPCKRCGAEINANWTIRRLLKQVESLQAKLQAVEIVLDSVDPFEDSASHIYGRVEQAIKWD